MNYLASFERRGNFEMEYRLKRHDGLWRWINDRGVFDAEHRFTGYIGSYAGRYRRLRGESDRSGALRYALPACSANYHRFPSI